MLFSRERVKHSLRTLARSKRFVALAIISLAVAIALNTTMYSVLDTMIDPKLAMREPEKLYWLTFYGDYRRLIQVNERNIAVRDGLTFHEGAAGAGWFGEGIVERGSRLREARVRTVTPNYFSLLGVRASAGRLFSQNDMQAESRPAVLSERLWRQLFPEKEQFEAATIFVEGEARGVVGLLPYEADFPGANTDVWQLPTQSQLPNMFLGLVRLRPNVTVAQMETELSALTLRYRQQTGEGTKSGWRFRSATERPFRPWRFHWALIGAVVGVMLIACANLANLQLARGVSRARELATRAAVGATRADIVGQLMLESGWLALGGLLLGGVLTVWGMHLVNSFVPPSISEYVTHTQVSWRVLLFAVGATLFCLVLVGLAPAIKLSRVDINELLKSGMGTGKTRSARRQYGALVVIEVALALSLLTSASLLMRAAIQVRSFQFGYDFQGLVGGWVGVARDGPNDLRTRRDWSERLIQQALRVDSVTSAATSISGVPSRGAISLDDAGGAPIIVPAPRWRYSVVSPDYLRTMKIPIVLGRDFSPGEYAEPQVIVDQRTARHLWPGVNPVGRLIKLDSARTRAPWLRVIGVAGTSRQWFSTDYDAMDQYEFRQARLGDVFVLNAADTSRLTVRPGRGNSTSQRWLSGQFFELVVRSRGDSRRVPLALTNRLKELGPNINPGWQATWEDRTGITRARAKQDFMASLFIVFAAFALALAALGVYAIIAHMVAQRTREFGVRIAVGAGEREIRELVLREGNILTLTGIAMGLLLTSWTATFVRAFVLSDYDRYDSRVFAGAALVLFIVSLLASYIPARRAMRINPVEALRND